MGNYVRRHALVNVRFGESMNRNTAVRPNMNYNDDYALFYHRIVFNPTTCKFEWRLFVICDGRVAIVARSEQTRKIVRAHRLTIAESEVRSNRTRDGQTLSLPPPPPPPPPTDITDAVEDSPDLTDSCDPRTCETLVR